MKTTKQIKSKAEELQKRLTGQHIYENFGQKEIRDLDTFIGDIWGYSYFDRAEVNQIKISFFHWCTTYTKK